MKIDAFQFRYKILACLALALKRWTNVPNYIIVVKVSREGSGRGLDTMLFVAHHVYIEITDTVLQYDKEIQKGEGAAVRD